MIKTLLQLQQQKVLSVTNSVHARISTFSLQSVTFLDAKTTQAGEYTKKAADWFKVGAIQRSVK